MYKILYTSDARKRIRKCDNKVQLKIKQAVKKLAKNPRLGKPLRRELKGRWSYRISDYRLIYRIYEDEILILILTIGHRRDVYKKQKGKQK